MGEPDGPSIGGLSGSGADFMVNSSVKDFVFDLHDATRRARMADEVGSEPLSQPLRNMGPARCRRSSLRRPRGRAGAAARIWKGFRTPSPHAAPSCRCQRRCHVELLGCWQRRSHTRHALRLPRISGACGSARGRERTQLRACMPTNRRPAGRCRCLAFRHANLPTDRPPSLSRARFSSVVVSRVA